MSERVANTTKPKGYGVFACRVCGKPMLRPHEAAQVSLRMFNASEAGYCSPECWKVGQKAGWKDRTE